MLRSALWLVLLVAAALPAAAQPATATLTGTVTDTDGQPLPGANVFLTQSQRGTISNAEGRFRLANVPLGAYRLVASIIGYETKSEDLVLREPGEVRTVNFRLKEAEFELGEVTVESTQDAKWQERYKRFERRFIGETENAAETEILNPYVLDFEDKRGHAHGAGCRAAHHREPRARLPRPLRAHRVRSAVELQLLRRRAALRRAGTGR